jgi:hypothetical protein
MGAWNDGKKEAIAKKKGSNCEKMPARKEKKKHHQQENDDVQPMEEDVYVRDTQDVQFPDDIPPWTFFLKGPFDAPSGFKYYVLPKGTLIAHGTGRYKAHTQDSHPLNPGAIKSRANFFGDPSTGYTYCEQRSRMSKFDSSPSLFVFRTGNDKRLLAMDQCETIHWIKSRPEFYNLNVHEAWMCLWKTGEPARNSTREIDLPIFQRICQIAEVEGTAAKSLKNGFTGTSFHPELYLCSGADLTYVNTLRVGVCKHPHPQLMDKQRGIRKYKVDQTYLQNQRRAQYDRMVEAEGGMSGIYDPHLGLGYGRSQKRCDALIIDGSRKCRNKRTRGKYCPLHARNAR